VILTFKASTFVQNIKIPPFGWPLYKIQKAGRRPANSVCLFIGHKAWKDAKSFAEVYPKRTLMIPPYLSANEFFWPVKGCDILIFDSGWGGVDYVDEIVERLYKDGARIVRSVCYENKLTVHQKDLSS